MHTFSDLSSNQRDYGCLIQGKVGYLFYFLPTYSLKKSRLNYFISIVYSLGGGGGGSS